MDFFKVTKSCNWKKWKKQTIASRERVVATKISVSSWFQLWKYEGKKLNNPFLPSEARMCNKIAMSLMDAPMLPKFSSYLKHNGTKSLWSRN